MHYQLIDLTANGDERGKLISLQNGGNCPFDVKRIFYIFDTKTNVARGCHANKNSQFLLIPVSGSCKVKIDNGKGSVENIILNNPHKGLWIDKMIWKEMYDFSDSTILLVITNTLYDKNEYIRNYNEFLKEVNV